MLTREQIAEALAQTDEKYKTPEVNRMEKVGKPDEKENHR